jgi:thioredoxin reductase
MTAAALYDVLIVGGGPSGQSAALTLARALQTAVVFDSGVYRNQRTSHMHTLPTWDHRSPAEFRAAARAEFLARYKTIQVHEHGLISIKKVDSGHFEAMSTDGQLWRGRKVVLATGVRDIMPDIEGYDSCWVKGMYVSPTFTCSSYVC